MTKYRSKGDNPRIKFIRSATRASNTFAWLGQSTRELRWALVKFARAAKRR